ncbi:putative ribonuclease H-like domain-containing protein [Tanacetum coccineum]
MRCTASVFIASKWEGYFRPFRSSTTHIARSEGILVFLPSTNRLIIANDWHGSHASLPRTDTRLAPSDHAFWTRMDVKSAFLYGTIEEEVYVCQPLGFEDPEFPNKVYKVEKALYGLHQAPRACQDKYVADILKKFDFATVRTASTPMETNKAFLKDEEVADVDVHLYRSMIGSLMYLTASRPDIMFAVCACTRFQVTPKTSHLHAVKRIFRYLKGQPKLGLWYPRDSPFDLEAFSDSDYVGASLDRKSTTGSRQFP